MKYAISLALLVLAPLDAHSQTNDTPLVLRQGTTIFEISGSKLVGGVYIADYASNIIRITAQHVSPEGMMSNIVIDAYGVVVNSPKGFWLQDGDEIVFRALPPVDAVPMALKVGGAEVMNRHRSHNVFDVRFAPLTKFRMISTFENPDFSRCVLADGGVSSVESSALVGTNIVVRWSGSAESNTANFGGNNVVTPINIAILVLQSMEINSFVEANPSEKRLKTPGSLRRRVEDAIP